MTLQPIVHYGIHVIAPLFIALIMFRSQWKKAYLIMVLGLLIDLDHLLAIPIFDPNRCSINYHPLHSNIAILIYFIMLLPKPSRLIGIGLVIHILADYIDCLLMQ